LDGTAIPLPPKAVKAIVPKPPIMKLNEAMINKGEALFNAYRTFCHQAGKPENYYSQYPNLAMMKEPVHRIFKNIVLDGAYAQNGMASFDDVLEESDIEALHHYLVNQQIDLFAETGNN